MVGADVIVTHHFLAIFAMQEKWQIESFFIRFVCLRSCLATQVRLQFGLAKLGSH